MKKTPFIKIICLILSVITVFAAFSTAAAAGTAKKSEAAAEFDADSSIMAYALLSDTPETKGMRVWMGDKNKPTTLVESGKAGWVMDPALATESRYIYVDLDDDLVHYNSDGRNIEVTVEYFDKGIGSLVLEYPDLDTANTQYKQRIYDTKPRTVTNLETDILDFKDSKTWKTHTWLIQHPSLNNEMSGADFRICIYSPKMGYSFESAIVSSVTVKAPGHRSQLGIEVSSDHLGNIYFTDETMELDIALNNNINPVYADKNGSYTADVKYSISNSDNRIVFEEEKKLKINPRAKTYDKISFKPEKYDLYVLKVEAKSEEMDIYSTETARCSYVWTTYGEIRNPRAGISIAKVPTEESEDFAMLLRNAGFTYGRHHFPLGQFGPSSYNNTEPNEWAQHQGYTEYMAALAKYGIIQYAYVGDSKTKNAAPVSNVDPSGNVPVSERGLNNFLRNNSSTLDIFGNTLGVYQFDNEMDLNRPTSDDAHAGSYANAVMKAYPELKKAYPDTVFVAGETSGLKEAWWTNFMKTGVYDYTDVLSAHVYTWSSTGTSLPENGTGFYSNIAALRRLMKEYGVEDKEVWLTEYGYSAYHQACKSEYQQACYDLMHYCILSSPGQFDKLFKFQFNNGNTPCRGEREWNFGLINATNYGVKDRCAAKQSYLQNSAMNILMYDAQQIERINMGQTICYRYNKTKSDDEMFVMFKDGEGESDTVSVDLGVNEVTFYDMYGNPTKLSSTNGTYTFAVDIEPFYVVGNFKRFKTVETSAVRPDSTLRSVSYGDAATVEFANRTGKTLTAKIELLPGSEIQTEETAEIAPGGSELKFRFGSSAPKGIEPVYITVSDNEGNVYFADDIFFKYSQPIALDATLNINGNKEWYLETTISNYASEKVYEGTIQLVSPLDWVDKVEKKKVVVNPGETITETLIIKDKDESMTRLTAGLAFITNESTAEGVYINKVFDFAYAPKANAVTIDANLSEWQGGWMYLNRNDQFEAVLGYDNIFYGPDDLWARVAVKWDDENFYFAGEVHDDVFYAQGVDASAMWSLDDFQLGIVYDPDNNLGQSAFEELSFALLDGTPTIYRHSTTLSNLANASKVDGAELAIVNNDKITYYELKVPWSSLIANFKERGIKIEAGNEIKLGVLLNENDGNGRKGYYKLGDGIANSKNSNLFTKLFMTE